MINIFKVLFTQNFMKVLRMELFYYSKSTLFWLFLLGLAISSSVQSDIIIFLQTKKILIVQNSTSKDLNHAFRFYMSS